MDISPDNWKVIKELFKDALEEEPAKRLSFLNKRCLDVNLRLEVEKLLAEHEQARDFLAEPAFAGLIPRSVLAPLPRTLAIGNLLVERFRIVRFIASGGMGIVYKAEDIRLHRFVALKFLPPEIAQDQQAIMRFHREARAASALKSSKHLRNIRRWRARK